jgi:drug/metabolite transporter (DMT)-like permease
MAGRRRDDTRVIAVVLCAIWGSVFVIQRVALEVAPPLWVAAARVAVGATALLVLAPRLRLLSRRGLGIAVLLGLLNQYAFITLQVSGLRTVAAGPAAAIIYVQPLLVVLGSGPFLGERLTRRRVVAALVGFAGVAVVGLHQSATASTGGVLLLLAGAVAWAAGALVTKATREPIIPLVVGQQLVAAPLLIATAALAEPFPPLTTKFVVCVVVAGLTGSALAWVLWSLLLRRGEASVVSTWLFAVPVLAAVLGVVFLGEPMSVALAVGIALVAVAVRLVAAAPTPG